MGYAYRLQQPTDESIIGCSSTGRGRAAAIRKDTRALEPESTQCACRT